MRRHDRARLAAALMLAALLGGGCAAKWAHRQGNEAAAQGDWDLAVARYTKAVEKDPDNIGYKIALENARIQASRYHYDRAKMHIAAKELEKAAEELEIASNYDPSNRSAADDLLLVREQIRKHEEEQRQRDQYDEMKARAEAARVPLPVLSPRSPVPITLKFQDASLEKIFDSLGRIAGVNILFDEGFRDKKYSVNLSGVTFEEALERLTFVNRLFYKVLDQNTIIVVPESRQKRVAYDELALRTFYLQNAELNETVNLIKTLAKMTTVVGNEALRAITAVGTLDQLAMAERIIRLNDKARGEVIVEVKIMEVNKNNMRQWGIDLANYSVGATLAPTGQENEVGEGGFTSVRAQFLSSLSRADWVVSVPSTVFLRFLQTDSTVKLISAPRLRAAEGKKAELRVGTEVPVPVTTFAAATSGISTFAPATSFQYRNVGVNLTVTPEVSASGDITLEVTAEFSLLGDDRAVSGGENPLTVPTFLTRNVTNVIRLRDGETGLIGGLLEQSQTRSLTGVLGVSSIPIIGDLFSDNSRRDEEREVVISLTPRIVRAPKVTEDDLMPLPVGTQAVPKVPGASPGLFGTEPEPEPEPEGVAPEPPSPTTPTAPTGEAGPGEAATTPTSAPASETAPPPGSSPLGSFPPAASPAETPGEAEAGSVNVLLSPPEVAVRAGQTGSVAVVVVGAQGVEEVELVLGWDPTLAEITEVKPGSLLTLDGAPVATARTLESGRARIRFTRTTEAMGSGAVAALTVRGLRPGSGSLTLQSVAVGKAGATVSLEPPPPGRIVVAAE
jgi:general secretion pathway protein D